MHKAAGGKDEHAPAQYFRLDVANALISELEKCADMHIKPKVSKIGRGGGTFVAKELVYAYAMWISAKFSLEVIRAYDAMVTGNVAALPSAVIEAVSQEVMKQLGGNDQAARRNAISF